jgi:hypothetical protein
LVNRQTESFLDLPVGKRSMPVMVMMPGEDDAPPFNFRAGMKPDM